MALSEVGRLVIRATTPEEGPREHDAAFAALVARFQNAAIAGAMAVVGDRSPGAPL
jgi:hypothetical protein